MKRLQTCRLVLFQVCVMTAIGAARPGTSDQDPRARRETSRGQKVDITSLSLEQLANVTVTSVSKKQESLEDAAAAIYVITGEQIRRSGLSSLPEVLRLAPGLTVQQLNAHAWTVSTRGFNGFPNEKMLVLIDGRSAYDPLSGGVYWDVQDVRLADIDRIEVIRGPGGALWGGNAVNGVINIISKPADETEGISTDASLGSGEGYQGSFRFGAHVGESFSYRITEKLAFGILPSPRRAHRCSTAGICRMRGFGPTGMSMPTIISAWTLPGTRGMSGTHSGLASTATSTWPKPHMR